MSYVLVAEPRAEGLADLKRLLDVHGYTCVAETGSGQAMRAVMDDDPDLIIADEEMDPIDGVELLPLLRRLSFAPIIALGQGTEERAVKVLLEGADMYLARPYSEIELLSRMKSLLRRAKQPPRRTAAG